MRILRNRNQRRKANRLLRLVAKRRLIAVSLKPSAVNQIRAVRLVRLAAKMAQLVVRLKKRRVAAPEPNAVRQVLNAVRQKARTKRQVVALAINVMQQKLLANKIEKNNLV